MRTCGHALGEEPEVLCDIREDGFEQHTSQLIRGVQRQDLLCVCVCVRVCVCARERERERERARARARQCVDSLQSSISQTIKTIIKRFKKIDITKIVA